MSCTEIWKDILSSSTEDLYKVPAGKGASSIVCHLGCAETGLLNDCLLLFRGGKSSKSYDYYTKMNWNVFSSWCESKVFPEMMKTNQKSVMAVDRATYHTYLHEDDKRSTSSWNRTKLADGIYQWDGIPDDGPLAWRTRKTEDELLERAKEIYPNPVYKLQKIADKFTKRSYHLKILFLPVAYPELNPIEMFWSNLKRFIDTTNMTFCLSSVEQGTQEVVESITAFEFKRYIEPVLKEEDNYRNLSINVIGK